MASPSSVGWPLMVSWRVAGGDQFDLGLQKCGSNGEVGGESGDRKLWKESDANLWGYNGVNQESVIFYVCLKMLCASLIHGSLQIEHDDSPVDGI